jgi:ribosome-associated translation inhibitor RaiA
MSAPEDVATVEQCLQALGGGTGPDDRAHIVSLFARLDRRLQSFKADEVELELSVKERDEPSQRTTLEAKIARRPVLVATSTETVFDQALVEVRDDLIRQLTDAKNRTEPRQNRHLRG